MRKKFTVEFWFRNQPIRAKITRKSSPAYTILNLQLDNPSLKPAESYYFIEGYDGNLELNQVPENPATLELLNEIARSIEDYYKKSPQPTGHGDTIIKWYRNLLTGRPGSAAA